MNNTFYYAVGKDSQNVLGFLGKDGILVSDQGQVLKTLYEDEENKDCDKIRKTLFRIFLAKLEKYFRRESDADPDEKYQQDVFDELAKCKNFLTIKGKQEDAGEFLQLVLKLFHLDNIVKTTFTRAYTNKNNIYQNIILLPSIDPETNYESPLRRINLETAKQQKNWLEIRDLSTLDISIKKEGIEYKNYIDLTSIKEAPFLVFQVARYDDKAINKITDEINPPEILTIDNSKELVLNAVVVHDGPYITGGHYVCYVKGKEGKWYLYDDMGDEKDFVALAAENTQGMLSHDKYQPRKNGTLFFYSSENLNKNIPRGVRNCGNTCYFDSVLMALLYPRIPAITENVTTLPGGIRDSELIRSNKFGKYWVVLLASSPPLEKTYQIINSCKLLSEPNRTLLCNLISEKNRKGTSFTGKSNLGLILSLVSLLMTGGLSIYEYWQYRRKNKKKTKKPRQKIEKDDLLE